MGSKKIKCSDQAKVCRFVRSVSQSVNVYQHHFDGKITIDKFYSKLLDLLYTEYLSYFEFYGVKIVKTVVFTRENVTK